MNECEPSQLYDGGRAADENYWSTRWNVLKPRLYSGPPTWHRIVAQHLPRRTDWTLFEIGCVPGGMLVYFNKEFGYRPAGIDYVAQLDLVEATLQLNGIPAVELHQADLFTFTPPHRYDVVFSAGFLEHFDDYMPAVRKHVEMVKPGGYLVVNVPNYTHAQYYLHSLFDAENLRKHRFEIMKPEILREAIRSCGMEVIMCSPTVTFDFWIVNRGHGIRRFFSRLVEGFAGRVTAVLDRLGLNNYSNRWFSPHILCIARKPDSGEEGGYG